MYCTAIHKNYMKKLNVYKTIVCIILFVFSVSCKKHETHVTPIVEQILETKQAIEHYIQQHPNSTHTRPIFITFWDFDGTILKGDCSEGLEEHGKPIYKGLVQVCIEKGYSAYYKNNEFKKFQDTYIHLDNTKGHRVSYAYLPTIFAGAHRDEILNIATMYFTQTLARYYFTSSIAILQKLKENNILIYVISASPEFFVKGASATIGIPQSHMYGIEVVTKNGVLTSIVTKPIPYAEGKTHTLKLIIEKLQNKYNTHHVYALAAFGNSYSTDGHFLHYIASQTLPAGKPVSVMINGGHPPIQYANLFTCVHQDAIIGH